MAPIWLSNFFEKDKVSLTKRETLWRKVQLNRSIKLVLPLLLSTARCLDLGITCSYADQKSAIAERALPIYPRQ